MISLLPSVVILAGVMWSIKEFPKRELSNIMISITPILIKIMPVNLAIAFTANVKRLIIDN